MSCKIGALESAAFITDCLTDFDLLLIVYNTLQIISLLYHTECVAMISAVLWLPRVGPSEAARCIPDMFLSANKVSERDDECNRTSSVPSASQCSHKTEPHECSGRGKDAMEKARLAQVLWTDKRRWRRSQ